MRRSVVRMDPIVTARYGLMAASRRFEASAAQVASLRSDEGVDLGDQVVDMVRAKQAFSANLAVVHFAQDMWDSLLQLQSR